MTTDPGDRTPYSATEAAALRDLLAPHAGRFVSFQDVEILALHDGYSNAVTPQGIYGFPVDWLAMLAADYAARPPRAGYSHHLKSLGFIRRPHLFTFALDGAVVDTATYTQWRADSARLHEMVREDEYLADLAARWQRTAHRHDPATGPGGDARSLLWNMERLIDAQLGLSGDGPYLGHPEKPGLWRQMFVQLGYVAFIDHDNLLTGDLPHQVAVFQPTALSNVVATANPCAAPHILA